jgi:glycosyltransferase involved in cell wall biosynthesis
MEKKSRHPIKIHKSGVRFSVCLIARNEAPNLWRLHKSLSEFLKRGGEVVLVDTGSKDDTVKVARNYGYRVFEEGEKFKHIVTEEVADAVNKKFIIEGEESIIKAGDKLFDFAAARNRAVELANNNIVSIVDCDEKYNTLNIDAIEKLIDEGYEQMEMHFIFCRYPNGQPAIQFRHCRTYDRRKMHWQGIVHEILVGQAKCTYLPQEIMLVEHHQAPHEHRSNYLPALALDCYLHPENDRNAHYFGRELCWNGRFKSAIQELNRHVAMNRWAQERGQSFIFIGDSYLALGEDDRALEAYHKSFTVDGTRREPLIKLAEYFYKKGDAQKTVCYGAAALEIPLNDCYCNIGSHYTNYPHEMLYWAFWRLGQQEKSKEHWQKAIAYDPQHPKYNQDRQYFEERNPVEESQVEQVPDGLLWHSDIVEKPFGKYPKSLNELLQKLISNEPFAFIKFGDGEQHCMEYVKGENCDGQAYSLELNQALRKAFNFLYNLPDTYIAFWRDKDSLQLGNILLHPKDKDLTPIHDFYKTLSNLDRIKVFIGPSKLSKVTEMLKAKFIEVPERNAFANYNAILDKLRPYCQNNSIFIFSCGLAAKPLIASVLEANHNVTCLDTGSAFDPIFLGQTRDYQPPLIEMQELYKDMISLELLIPKKIFTIWGLPNNETMPPFIEKCINSQRAVLGYEHKIIGLKDIPRNISYVEKALASGKWIKAVDYLRMWYLEKEGGIYCDADMEILSGKNFDNLLQYKLFVCQEENCFIANSIMGSIPHHPIMKECLREIEEKFSGDDAYVFEAAQEVITPKIYLQAYGEPRCLWLAPGKVASDYTIKILSPEYFFPYNHQDGTIRLTDNTIGFHHFMKSWASDSPNFLPRVGILIPTLERESGLKRCLDSIDRLYYPKHLIDVIIDNDKKATVPQKVNRMYRANNNSDVYVFAANDTEFESWSLYNAVKASKNHGLVTFNTGELYPDKSNICEHFLIRKDLIEKFGEIFSEKFFHVGCDNLLWSRAIKINEAHRCEDAKMIHHHFSREPKVMDDIYRLGWSHREEDRKILKEELAKLECST